MVQSLYKQQIVQFTNLINEQWTEIIKEEPD